MLGGGRLTSHENPHGKAKVFKLVAEGNTCVPRRQMQGGWGDFLLSNGKPDLYEI